LCSHIVDGYVKHSLLIELCLNDGGGHTLDCAWFCGSLRGTELPAYF